MPDFEAMTTDEIRAHRETVFLRLLIRVSQIETMDLVERLHGRGHGAVQRAHIPRLLMCTTCTARARLPTAAALSVAAPP